MATLHERVWEISRVIGVNRGSCRTAPIPIGEEQNHKPLNGESEPAQLMRPISERHPEGIRIG
jgi:hypothetical protein